MTDTAMNDSISAQVAALPGLPMKDLWALWDTHFPRRPAHTNLRMGIPCAGRLEASSRGASRAL